MNKIVSLCQLAFRARKVAIGSTLIPSIQNKTACLVLYSNICGKNRKKKLRDKCSFYQIPIYEIEDEYFSKISNTPIQSLSIIDKGFAQAIITEMKG